MPRQALRESIMRNRKENPVKFRNGDHRGKILHELNDISGAFDALMHGRGSSAFLTKKKTHPRRDHHVTKK